MCDKRNCSTSSMKHICEVTAFGKHIKPHNFDSFRCALHVWMFCFRESQTLMTNSFLLSVLDVFRPALSETSPSISFTFTQRFKSSCTILSQIACWLWIEFWMKVTLLTAVIALDKLFGWQRAYVSQSFFRGSCYKMSLLMSQHFLANGER